ncbi:protein indeterminate-domain 7-like [Andrographis paniculata]|uniref:protein indeterminate-domain 7-like n=1 Tax=Andrographis paniculata TaxID=175694 RepID=UPI0021E93B3D|nr:protein indeterminate-domain 7-like [Andrographis paniculata]XP_051137369.1 protein indeterminate-domain 7-like [Andrographis paniculata]
MVVDDNMSNLTSAISNEASISSNSNIINEIGTTLYLQHHLPPPSLPPAPANNYENPPPPKKKRNLPGNPDPEAEVVALSPRSLMATNRFVCEICNKGFQRDQNLQLHRRGHNLPWKLKQRSTKEVPKKKVYVCPEISCVHHDPSRALGDLTGIKKHFSRKHGEKKWKCQKCSKRYAVQSDWKAHSKICGTREYRCDCGTLFSRRDSFITHRAFCDALAQESSRSSMAATTLIQNPFLPNNHNLFTQTNSLIPPKQETPQNLVTLPPWLSPNSPININPLFPIQENPNPNPKNSSNSHILNSLISSNSSNSLMSATALLQKAAQMGVTMSSKNLHQSSGAGAATAPAALQSRDHEIGAGSSSFLQDMTTLMMAASSSSSSTTAFESPLQQAFQGPFDGLMINHRNSSFHENGHLIIKDDGLTRDFLGLRAFPDHHHHPGSFVAMDGLDQLASSSYGHHQTAPNQPPWQS